MSASRVPTALVTGATGGVGRALVASLSADGLGVRAIVRPESVGGPAADGLARHRGVEVVRAALDDDGALAHAARGCEVVVHLAAQTRPAPWWVHTRVTVEGTASVVRAARYADVARFVHVSSAAVYGPLPAREAVAEDAPLHGRGAYAEAKIVAEQVVARARGLAAVALRPTLVYGEGIETGLLEVADRLARQSRPGSGPPERMQPVHVDDVVRAIRGALGHPEVGGAVNVAGPDTVAVDELAHVLDRLRRGRAAGTVTLLAPRYSTDRLRRELGVRARVGLAEGLASARPAS